MRLNEAPIEQASDRASTVLPTPGTSSISTWPPATNAVSTSRTASGLPTTTRPMLAAMRSPRSRMAAAVISATSVPVAISLRSLRPRYEESEDTSGAQAPAPPSDGACRTERGYVGGLRPRTSNLTTRPGTHDPTAPVAHNYSESDGAVFRQS